MRKTNRQSEFEIWFSQAEHALSSAWHLTEAGDHDFACFLSQQAAELALKAYLLRIGRRFSLTHSIADLLEQCTRHQQAFQAVAGSQDLDLYYLATRYPDALQKRAPKDFYTEEHASRGMRLASSVIELIRGLTTAKKKRRRRRKKKL